MPRLARARKLIVHQVSTDRCTNHTRGMSPNFVIELLHWVVLRNGVIVGNFRVFLFTGKMLDNSPHNRGFLCDIQNDYFLKWWHFWTRSVIHSCVYFLRYRHSLPFFRSSGVFSANAVIYWLLESHSKLGQL